MPHLLQDAPEYNYQDEQGECRFRLQEAGIYLIRPQGTVTETHAQFICRTLVQLQSQIRSQSHFSSLVIDILSERTTPAARNYLLRHLRWERIDSVIQIYLNCPDHLSSGVMLLLGRLNHRTRFIRVNNFKQGVSAARKDNAHFLATHCQHPDLTQRQSEQDLWNKELQVYRYDSRHHDGKVFFFQPHPHTLYVRLVGKISPELLQHVIPTYRNLLKTLETYQNKYAVIVDFKRVTQIKQSLALGLYRNIPPRDPRKQLYFIAPNTFQSQKLKWVYFILRHFFKDAHFVKDHHEAETGFFKGLKKPEQSLPVTDPTQSPKEELQQLKKWILYQENLRREEQERHTQEIQQIQQIIWQLLLRENKKPIPIHIPDQESPATETLQLLDVFQRDQLQLLKDLQEQIDERTRAEQRAAHASEIKSEFLAAMSHDIRTPLNAILGFTRVLRLAHQDPLSAVQQLYLERIQDNGTHLLNLVNDILDLSQLEAGKVELKPQQVNLHTLTTTILEQLDVLIHNKGLQVCIDVDADTSIFTDPKRLQQIIVNLLNNAIKFTEPQGRIYVECERDAQNNPLALHIRDTGCGIAPEAQQRIFEAFERGSANPQKQEGSGLGLAICTRLCQYLNYHLQLKSQWGEGSQFSIYFYAQGNEGQRS